MAISMKGHLEICKGDKLIFALKNGGCIFPHDVDLDDLRYVIALLVAGIYKILYVVEESRMGKVEAQKAYLEESGVKSVSKDDYRKKMEGEW